MASRTREALGYGEDEVAETGDTGLVVLAVRRDIASSEAADGDYVTLSVDNNGRLRVIPLAGGLGGLTDAELRASPVPVLGPTSSTSSTETRTAVTSTAVVQLLAANVNRKQFLIQNADILPIHLVLGPGTPTTTVYHVVLKACTNADDGTGGSYISDMWKGPVRAIAQQILTITNGAVVVTELT